MNLEKERFKREIKWKAQDGNEDKEGNSTRTAKKVERRKEELNAEGRWQLNRVSHTPSYTDYQCEFCHTHIKHSFHIEHPDSGQKLIVGSTCVVYFSNLDAEVKKVKKEIGRRKRKITVFKIYTMS